MLFEQQHNALSQHSESDRKWLQMTQQAVNQQRTRSIIANQNAAWHEARQIASGQRPNYPLQNRTPINEIIEDSFFSKNPYAVLGPEYKSIISDVQDRYVMP
jgi:hypothetical protein